MNDIFSLGYVCKLLEILVLSFDQSTVVFVGASNRSAINSIIVDLTYGRSACWGEIFSPELHMQKLVT